MYKCKKCCKQYFCKLVNSSSKTSQECKDFISWIQTKNYGEVKRIEGTKSIYKQ